MKRQANNPHASRLKREAIPFTKGDTWDDDMLTFAAACERQNINPNKDRFYVAEIAALYGVQPLTVYYWFKRSRGSVQTYQDSKGRVFAFRHDLVSDLQNVIPSGMATPPKTFKGKIKKNVSVMQL